MTATTTAHGRAWSLAAEVPDPEIPVVTIEDLGILRDVTEDDQGRVHVQITPTYSGCPAMETIRTDIEQTLTDAGYQRVDVEFVLWLGVRFHLAREFALTVRLGTPSILIGASFFL